MSDMKKLYELAKLIRSKNAGPFVVTMDILFPDHDMYQRVLESICVVTRPSLVW